MPRDDDHDFAGFATVCQHLIHFAAGQPGSLGAGVSFAARTRLQSRPSMSAESCAADSRITPFSIFGQLELAVL